MILILPIPDSELATNKSKGWHYGKHVVMRKKARIDGFKLALEYETKHFPIYKTTYTPINIKGNWQLHIKVFHRNNKHLDDDNLLSALKNVRDGVFDLLKTRFNMNDKQITLTILDTSFRDKINPRIEWELKPRI